MVPYWSTKKGRPPYQELEVTQVSPRGGRLRSVWKKEEKTVLLRGQLFVFATGQLYM